MRAIIAALEETRAASRRLEAAVSTDADAFAPTPDPPPAEPPPRARRTRLRPLGPVSPALPQHDTVWLDALGRPLPAGAQPRAAPIGTGSSRISRFRFPAR